MSTQPESIHTSARFLIDNLDSANSFMTIAVRNTAAANAEQEYEQARRAYDAVASYVMHAQLTRDEHEQIIERMRALAARLRAFERRRM